MTAMNDAERAGFEAVYGTIKPEDHATGDDQAVYELERMAFQAGAAWQRAQGTVPHPLRYTNDGELAECPCCGSVDVGGAHDTVNCYGCGLQITKPRPLKNAVDAWNRRTQFAVVVPDEKPLPDLMMSSYHEAIGWNAYRKALLAAAPSTPAAQGAVPDGYALVSVELLKSVLDPVCTDDWAPACKALRAMLAAVQPQASAGKDVHTEHCCKKHGCKYSDPACTVAYGDKVQSFPCEDCDEESPEQASAAQSAPDDVFEEGQWWLAELDSMAANGTPTQKRAMAVVRNLLLCWQRTQAAAVPVGWQFYQDGKWWNGDDRVKDHRKNTVAAGVPVRDVYAAPAQPAVQGEQQPVAWRWMYNGEPDGPYAFNYPLPDDDVVRQGLKAEHPRTVQPLYAAPVAQTEQSEVQRLREALEEIRHANMNGPVSESNAGCIKRIEQIAERALAASTGQEVGNEP